MLHVLAATGAEESGGTFLVQPEGGLMLWTLLCFGGALLVLWKFAFPRISEALEKRQALIEDSIDHAEQTRKNADELLAEYRERLAAARSQADEIVARARRTGENVEAEAAADAKRKREEMMEQTRREIATETDRALAEIRAQVADLTILATEKVTRKTLSQADQERLVEDALKELDFRALSQERANV